MFYCMFCFTCDRSFSERAGGGRSTIILGFYRFACNVSIPFPASATSGPVDDGLAGGLHVRDATIANHFRDQSSVTLAY